MPESLTVIPELQSATSMRLSVVERMSCRAWRVVLAAERLKPALM